MDRAETLKIMTILKVAYPMYYKGISKEEAEMVVSLWEMHFKEYPYNLIATSVNAFISTDNKGFPPTIGVIKDKVYKIMNPNDKLTELEAWNLVSKAINDCVKDFYYFSEDIFNNLPTEIKEILGSYNTLNEWSRISSIQRDTVIASNFQRAYREKMDAKREFALLPSNIKKSIENYENKYKMLEKKEESQ